MIDLAEVARALAKRNIKVAPPASQADLRALEQTLGGSLHPFLRSLYSAFDGFQYYDFDQRSFIGAWPIARIVASDPLLFEGDWFPFADYSFESNVLLQSRSDPAKPVLRYWGREVVAPSSLAFWTDLAAGRLDE